MFAISSIYRRFSNGLQLQQLNKVARMISDCTSQRYVKLPVYWCNLISTIECKNTHATDQLSQGKLANISEPGAMQVRFSDISGVFFENHFYDDRSLHQLAITDGDHFISNAHLCVPGLIRTLESQTGLLNVTGCSNTEHTYALAYTHGALLALAVVRETMRSSEGALFKDQLNAVGLTAHFDSNACNHFIDSFDAFLVGKIDELSLKSVLKAPQYLLIKHPLSDFSILALRKSHPAANKLSTMLQAFNLPAFNAFLLAFSEFLV